MTPTSAVIWMRGLHAGEARVDVTPETPSATSRRATLVLRAADDLTGKAQIGDLAPAMRHRYRVTQDAESVTGEFVTAPPPAEAARVRFLWSGDLGGGGFCRPLAGGYAVFPVMLRYPSDFFLFVGDTAYADVPCDKPDTAPGANFRARTVEQFRARQLYNRGDPGLQAFLRSRSVYAIWDDHEVRNDFAGTTEPLMPLGRRAFLDYWPVAPPAEDPARLYRSVRWGRLLELFILDTRQYRSDNGLRDGPDKTMLGAAQRRWLVDAVSASTATWKVVVSSVTLALGTGRPERRDGWSGANVFGFPQEGAGFMTERDAILDALRARGVRNLVFVAADVHHAEVIRHQPQPDWSFHELIAGPLSATFGRPRPLDMSLNPRSLFARGGVFNFGEVTIEATGLTVRLVDDTGGVLFTHTVTPE
ncbi:MAG TPA: alkaline phosphatase D family protein [Methylomirabilota bacterium]|nr:alkaline phosphatase D family protein [Methylomirabilota bacterium]